MDILPYLHNHRGDSIYYDSEHFVDIYLGSMVPVRDNKCMHLFIVLHIPPHHSTYYVSICSIHSTLSVHTLHMHLHVNCLI